MSTQHALAVQRAIAQAQRDNQAFLQREALAVAPEPTGVLHSVSAEDAVIGLRIGGRLMLVDKQENKAGSFVSAIDALLSKARTALGDEEGASLSTPVGKTQSMLTIVRGAGGKVQIYFQDKEALPRQAVDAIGKLDWQV